MQVTAPDNTVYKDYSHASGWDTGLTRLAEWWFGTTRKKYVSTKWTQDNEALSYPQNPRVLETNIYDDALNRRRTTVSYNTFTLPSGASCSLPSDVYEYDSNASTVLRHTHTDYNLSTTYTNLRIIGLPATKYVCDGSPGGTPCGDTSGGALFSKVGFQYDELGSVTNQGSPVQHDDPNYGSGFVAGRGNVSSTKRYDVTNLTQYVTSTVGYNTAGSVISSTDASSHQTSISYGDSFSVDGTSISNPGVTTLAYPTAMTDADGYSSTAWYNYDFGAVTRTHQPASGTSPSITYLDFTRKYDAYGRLQQVNQPNEQRLHAVCV